MIHAQIDASEFKALATAMRTAPMRMAGPLQVFLGRITSIWQRAWATLLGKKPFPHYQGQAANSIQRGQAVNFTGHRVQFQGRAYSPLIHVAVLEKGRRRGARFPPVDAITRWVWLRQARGDIRITVPPGQGPASARKLRAVRSVGFLISRAIHRRGLKGKRFARKAARQTHKRVRRELRVLSGSIARIFVRGPGQGLP